MEDTIHTLACTAVEDLHRTTARARVELAKHEQAERAAQFLRTYIATAERQAVEHEKAGREIKRLQDEVTRLELAALGKQGGPS